MNFASFSAQCVRYKVGCVMYLLCLAVVVFTLSEFLLRKHGKISKKYYLGLFVKTSLVYLRMQSIRMISMKMKAILKHPGSSRFGKEDPGYLRRCLQVIFSTFFFLKFCKEDPGYLRRFFSNF